MGWEIPTIRMSVLEALGNVDEILILEHNFTHTGEEHLFGLRDDLRDVVGRFGDTIINFVEVDLSREIIRDANSSADLHYNERLMRGSFEQFTALQGGDIVSCVDADEVIFRHSFESLSRLARMDPFQRVWAIPMHQLYYRPDYLWTDCNFASAVVGRARSLRRGRNPWRDSRWKARGVHGCHFSWHLTVDQMLTKLEMYSHALDYGHLASRDVLADAIRSRTYPFDSERDFTIRQLDEEDMKDIFPESWATEHEGFAHLFEDGS